MHLIARLYLDTLSVKRWWSQTPTTPGREHLVGILWVIVSGPLVRPPWFELFGKGICV